MPKPKVLLLGKLPPPMMGPALATQVIMDSALHEEFQLEHFDTRLNKSLQSMGRPDLGKVIRMQQQYARFKKTLIRFKPHLVHIPIGQTTLGFWKDARYINMASRMGCRILLHLRGSAFRDWYENNSPRRRRAIREVLNKTHGVIVLSKSLKYLFQSLMPPEKIHVVPNGADFDLPIQRANGAQNVNILYLSNFLHGKGFDTLVAACAELKKRHVKGWKLQAHGQWDNPKFRTRCQALIAENGLQKCVKIGEPLYGEQKWNSLAQADIYAFTPRSPEGLPWSLIEAAAAKLPAVTTRQGAIPDTLIPGESGFLHEPGAVENIATSLARLISDKVLRKRFSENARRHYEEFFTANHMVNALSHAYRNCLEAQCAE